MSDVDNATIWDVVNAWIWAVSIPVITDVMVEPLNILNDVRVIAALSREPQKINFPKDTFFIATLRMLYGNYLCNLRRFRLFFLHRHLTRQPILYSEQPPWMQNYT
jgi:hypothetical protein